ncbi:hypothetical protein ACH4GK_32165 [Streptomyces rimosus]|uniref:hypothetical protein n=1 Tax=Streptomyces rimosus TaxID=1927 RepID=UPI0004CC47D7|nr:hypothetical protein [Streptomyces rimosus]
MPSKTPPTIAADEAVLVEAAKARLDEEEPLFNVGPAAKIIGCGERWLRDGAIHGGLPHTRLGKFLKFSLEDCREIRRLHRVPAKPGVVRRPRKKAAARPVKAAA